MEQLLEFLIPVIIFVLWIAGQFFERRKQGQGEEDLPEPDQGEQNEQARRIQEEIRRKIEARRSQQRGEETPPPQGAHPPMAPEPARRQTVPPPLQPSPYSTTPTARKTLAPTPVKRLEPHYEESVQPDIFAELAEQEKRMRQTERRAEEARAQARKRISSSTGLERRHRRVPRTPGSLRTDVIETIRDPMAARKAILYSEILGTPVGQRRDGQMRPAWKS